MSRHSPLPTLALLTLLSLTHLSCATTGPDRRAGSAPAELAAFAASAAFSDDETYIRVVDVGPGLCTVTRVPGPHYLVYDAGHWRGEKCIDAVRDIVPGDDVDLLIISHSDSDHLADGAKILKQYAVHQIWRTGFRRDDTRSWRRLNKAIGQEVQDDSATVINLATVPLAPGHQVQLGDAQVTFLAGWSEWTEPGPTASERRNAISIVVRLDYEGHSVLYGGDTVGRRLGDPDDACKDAEKVMVERHQAGDIDLDADVLIVPHHGGNNGSSTCFIEAVTPEIVVFSAGHDHQHPSAGAAARYLAAGVDLDDIYRTDRSDDEEGPFEWKEGSRPGCNDGRGDDDVEIRLLKAGPAEVGYRTEDASC